jgi:hypothetical protein
MTELQRCEIAKDRGYTYNPITGEILGMKGSIVRGTCLGYVVFSVNCNGKKERIYAHRYAWYLHYGELPNNFIDHIDGNRANNILTNLRDVTKQQNGFNRTTAKGYGWHKRNKRFQASIRVNGKHIYLGFFINEEDARNAYLTAKAKYHVIN